MSAGKSARRKEKPFVISRQFDASRELVWKSWTAAERLKQWWGPKGSPPGTGGAGMSTPGAAGTMTDGGEGKKNGTVYFTNATDKTTVSA